jgi:site-specific recombinase XerD
MPILSTHTVRQTVSTSPTQGGASSGTVKRYKTVFDKFATFAEESGIRYWQQVNKEILRRYGKWLDDRDYHDKTQYIELTVIK